MAVTGIFHSLAFYSIRGNIYFNEYFTLLLLQKNYNKSEAFIYELLNKKDSPEFYLLLKKLYETEGKDPELMLIKAAQLAPDDYTIINTTNH